MATNEIIAAIELSSSRIAGVAGYKQSDGTLRILAYTQESAHPFVHKGLVYNIDKAAQAITTVVDRLNEQLDQQRIARVYTAVSGVSLHTQKNAVSRTVEEDTVSQLLVDSICDENRTYPLEDMDILDVAPQEYRIDNTLHTEAVGVAGAHITGQFLNIVARTAIKKNLEQGFYRAKVEIADLFIAPIAQANVVLTTAEMRSGCALIDMGADTTSVSLYKNNILRYLAVIPMGSSSITRDITTLQMEEGEAEQLKLTYGDAYYEEEEGDSPAVITLNDGRTIERAQLNDIVAARTDELLANAWEQIKLSGYSDHLLAGVVFTGGGSNLKNIDVAFRRQSKLTKVRIAYTIQPAVEGHTDELRPDAAHCTILALLAAGRDNCVEAQEVAPAPQPETLSETQPPATPQTETPQQPGGLFDDDEDLILQTEEAIKQKEEEKKAKKEAKKGTKESGKIGGKKEGFSKWFSRFTDNLFGDSEMGDNGQ
jgi:cell division protein FtsA